MTEPASPRPYERPALEDLGTLGAMTQGSLGLLGDGLLQGPLLGGGTGGDGTVGGSA